MVEIVDNLAQLLVALSCCALAGIAYLKSRKQPYFLLCCFYGCFGLGVLYWLLYTVLAAYTPAVFYVADIGWISAFLFLLMLQNSIASKEERGLRSWAPWLALAIELPLTAYYLHIGDVLYNLIDGALMAALLTCALRGLIWQSRKPKPNRSKQLFHLSVIGYITLENCLWLSSYPWAGDTLANPYFWLDFALTASLLTLFPATRKAVRA